ncbi:uncharacterized protein FTJAE_3503 [Fusarium tjaetaba]|uniref:Uncharacterized protein n=1 Tax=Fusarium tjaetaba TaxID=1567544 RepID=A0A8H5S270_9HYPO|nr:uncharacterized protein FTJAE_3503 [Fusarium tjaetaba]KAF5642787.1 hypothetical protein FTJAE_3503 [Fusarium tjaetaba]
MLILRCIVAVHPAKLTIQARISEAKTVDMESLSKANFKAVIGVLHSTPRKEEPDTKLAHIRRTITHVDRFLSGNEINDFIRSQEESEIVTEFRLANPDKEAELVKLSRQQYTLEHMLSPLHPEPSKEGVQTLCQTFGIAEWPDLRLYPEREDVQSLKSHQVEVSQMLSAPFNRQRHQEELYNMEMETQGESDIRFYPSLILTLVNSICQTWKEGHENFKNPKIIAYYSTPSNGRVVVISTYPTWSSRAVLKRERLFVFKAGKVPELVMKQRTKTRYSSETQEEDVEDVEDKLEEEATIKNYTTNELNMDDIKFIARNETEALKRLTAISSKFPQFAQLEEVFKKSNGSYRLWMINPIIFRTTGDTLNWGQMLAILLCNQFQEASSSPYQEDTTLMTRFDSMGQIQAQKLFNQKKDPKIEDIHRSGNSQAINGQVKDPSPELNFGEHRKGVLTSFDWRNYKIMYPDNPVIFGQEDAVNKRIKDLGDPNTVRTNSQMERENKKQAARSTPVSGVDEVEELLRNDIKGGLRFFFHRTNSDASFLPPGGPSSYIHWLCYMGTGVNMHTCCYRGILMHWLMKAKGMLQTIYCLIRINHPKTVEFHLLKLKNSYYDNIERICVAKLMRYARFVSRHLGISLSTAMPGLLSEMSAGSWTENVDWIVDGCRELTCTFESPDEIEAQEYEELEQAEIKAFFSDAARPGTPDRGMRRKRAAMAATKTEADGK